jgi:hypothetical protein
MKISTLLPAKVRASSRTILASAIRSIAANQLVQDNIKFLEPAITEAPVSR